MQATQLVNHVLNAKFLPRMPLGVLSGVGALQEAAVAKLLRQQRTRLGQLQEHVEDIATAVEVSPLTSSECVGVGRLVFGQPYGAGVPLRVHEESKFTEESSRRLEDYKGPQAQIACEVGYQARGSRKVAFLRLGLLYKRSHISMEVTQMSWTCCRLDNAGTEGCKVSSMGVLHQQQWHQRSASTTEAEACQLTGLWSN